MKTLGIMWRVLLLIVFIIPALIACLIGYCFGQVINFLDRFNIE